MPSSGIFDRLIELVDTCESLEHFKSIARVIPRPRTFVQSCRQLDQLVGLDRTKTQIVEKIKVMIVRAILQSQRGQRCQIFREKEMFHTVFDGPPGVGKSRISRLVAKLLYSLGIDLRCSVVPIISMTPPSPARLPPSNEANKLQDYGEGIITTASNLHQCLTQLQLQNDMKINESRESTPRSSPVPVRFKPASPRVNPIWKRCQDQLNQLNLMTSELRLRISELSGNSLEVPVSNIIDNPDIDESAYLVIAGREQLVGAYMGQTATQVDSFIKNHAGKIIILEEAYTMYSGAQDTFGMEALTVICRAMDENPEQNTFFFNGYTQQLHESIFKAQPGLRRRISQTYSCLGYTAIELAAILEQQLLNLDISADSEMLREFMLLNVDKFPNYAGDTLRFSMAVEVALCGQNFERLLSSTQFDGIVTRDILNAAFARFMLHAVF